MKRNLILFSGGVESTALLVNSKADDILVTIKPVFKDYLPGYSVSGIEKISEYYNQKINYCNVEIPLTQGTFVHQMRYFVFVSSLWVSRDSSIQEVWCGRNSAEPSQNIKPFIDSMMDLWNIMHPNVLFKHPLDHLSKKEQWDLIPLEIKSYISSCCTANNCGKCFKCRELVENNIPQ